MVMLNLFPKKMPSYIEFNPPNINGLSLAMIPKNSAVLDLGCGGALLGRFMQENLGCKVTGVEIDPKLAEIAKKGIDKVIVGDLEDKKIQKIILRQPKFDVIFASEVLEHLQHPQFVLKNLTKSLKSDHATIIITLPNIAYWFIRLQLLLGKFDYTKSGILSEGHLKFFTLKSAVKFIEKDCGLKIEEIKFAFPDLPVIHRMLNLIPSFGKKVESAIYKAHPTIFAYQMAFKTKLK